jgi:hypothetical protein
MNNQTLKELIATDDDFIYCPKFNNSIKKLLTNHPNGLTLDRIAKVLLMTEDEVKQIYKTVLKKMRRSILKGS